MFVQVSIEVSFSKKDEQLLEYRCVCILFRKFGMVIAFGLLINTWQVVFYVKLPKQFSVHMINIDQLISVEFLKRVIPSWSASQLPYFKG